MNLVKTPKGKYIKEKKKDNSMPLHRCNKEAEISQILTEQKLTREILQAQFELQKKDIESLHKKQDEMYKRLFDKDGLISEHEQVKGALKGTQVLGGALAFLITLYVTLKDKLKFP